MTVWTSKLVLGTWTKLCVLLQSPLIKAILPFFICGFIKCHSSCRQMYLRLVYILEHVLWTHVPSSVQSNGQVKHPAFKEQRLHPTLTAALLAITSSVFFQVALLHCSLQLIINSPLLHCPTFAPGRLLKFYFIIYSNLRQGGLFI